MFSFENILHPERVKNPVLQAKIKRIQAKYNITIENIEQLNIETQNIKQAINRGEKIIDVLNQYIHPNQQPPQLQPQQPPQPQLPQQQLPQLAPQQQTHQPHQPHQPLNRTKLINTILVPLSRRIPNKPILPLPLPISHKSTKSPTPILTQLSTGKYNIYIIDDLSKTTTQKLDKYDIIIIMKPQNPKINLDNFNYLSVNDTIIYYNKNKYRFIAVIPGVENTNYVYQLTILDEIKTGIRIGFYYILCKTPFNVVPTINLKNQVLLPNQINATNPTTESFDVQINTNNITSNPQLMNDIFEHRPEIMLLNHVVLFQNGCNFLELEIKPFYDIIDTKTKLNTANPQLVFNTNYIKNIKLNKINSIASGMQIYSDQQIGSNISIHNQTSKSISFDPSLQSSLKPLPPIPSSPPIISDNSVIFNKLANIYYKCINGQDNQLKIGDILYNFPIDNIEYNNSEFKKFFLTFNNDRNIEKIDLINLYEQAKSDNDKCNIVKTLYLILRHFNLKHVGVNELGIDTIEKLKKKYTNYSTFNYEWFGDTKRHYNLLILLHIEPVELGNAYLGLYDKLTPEKNEDLHTRLANIGYQRNNTIGGGNCYYAAIGMQVIPDTEGRTQYDKQVAVRRTLLAYIDENRQKFKDLRIADGPNTNPTLNAIMNPAIYNSINALNLNVDSTKWGDSALHSSLVSLVFNRRIVEVPESVRYVNGNPIFNTNYIYQYWEPKGDGQTDLDFIQNNFTTQQYFSNQAGELKQFIETYNAAHPTEKVIVMSGGAGHWEYCTPINQSQPAPLSTISGGSRQTKKIIKSSIGSRSSKTTRKNIKK